MVGNINVGDVLTVSTPVVGLIPFVKLSTYGVGVVPPHGDSFFGYMFSSETTS